MMLNFSHFSLSAKMYAVQEGIKLANDKESKGYLMGIMDELDQVSLVHS